MENKIDNYFQIISSELAVKPWQVKATAGLLDEGGTVPFISRYRKEATGSLDEVAVASVRDRLEQLREMDKRRDAIFKSLEERELLTDELKEKLIKADSMTEIEDIYLPFRPKRRTRATVAKEKGLEPLAVIIFAQDEIDPENEAKAFIDDEKGVDSVDVALAGARDIIAEWVSEDKHAREKMRELYMNKAVVKSKVISGKEDLGIKYKDYYEWEEPVQNIPSHRMLAIRRGEHEEFLILRINPAEEDAVDLLEAIFVKGTGQASAQVQLAVQDSYKRLLSSSIETEMRLAAKKRADKEAIKVFVENLRQLLLSPPLGRKTVLAIDPGFRTGCKLVCLDRQGKLLHNDTIYLQASEKKINEASVKISELCKEYKIEAIAIGNGTASRETETFIKSIGLSKEINIIMVNESGASVYSASEVAREEFPDHDITVRGSVSIGRRLMDPLSELVKIDPKSIGVGQYQHDVDQAELKRNLDDVVTSCVNGVGVEANTAGRQLLTYVSGLGPQLAKSIVDYRNEHGSFRTREELKKVPRLGPKAFEQAAGFMRIGDGDNPLDSSAVHPESYCIVNAMAKDAGCNTMELINNDQVRKSIDLSRYVTDTVGMPTLTDIMDELDKPGRDPREKFETFSFTEGVEKIGDLKQGMKLPGIVTNITAFGVFVDLGVHQDGLVHISELADRFVKNPADVVKVQQKVMVTVMEIDIQRKRIALSMKSGQAGGEKKKPKEAVRDKTKKASKRVNKSVSKQKSNNKSKNGFSNNPFYEALRGMKKQ